MRMEAKRGLLKIKKRSSKRKGKIRLSHMNLIILRYSTYWLAAYVSGGLQVQYPKGPKKNPQNKSSFWIKNMTTSAIFCRGCAYFV